jgi:pilus assembly protein CpaC
LNLLLYNSGLNIGLTLQDLQDKQIAQILAEPTITTLSGQKASFLSGGEFPFPVVQGSSGGLTSITIQFRPYGVKLDFTPIVNDDGTIQLKVAPEVSALDYTNAVTISGYTIPAISTRRAETQVELRDGQSFAISGLLDHRTTDILSKMPGIGDVPILGQLFRSKNINHSTVELIVVVTPSLVDPLTDTTSPSLPKFPVPMLDPAQFDKKTGKQKPATQPQPGTGGPQ